MQSDAHCFSVMCFLSCCLVFTRQHAALYLSVVASSLKANILLEVGVTAAQTVEAWKHAANDQRCSDLGWACVPLAVKFYGALGQQITGGFSHLASRLAVHTSCN